MGDMVRTLAIFAVLIVAFVAFLPKNHQPPVAQPVDYSVSLAALRGQAPFPVYAPVLPPTGWTPNHVTTHVATTTDPSTSFDLGFYIVASRAYAQVEQSNAAGFTAVQLGKTAHQTGTEVIAGTSWQTWTDSGGHPALVRAVQSSTLVLNGQATAAQLATLAGTLSLAPAQQVPGTD
jgi:hypothetical protein